jgi:pimeloyl-ACP methyl ester carboxylesterase
MRGVKRAGVVALAIAALLLMDRPWGQRSAHQAEWLTAGDVTVRAVRAGQGDTTLFFLHGYSESLLSFRGPFDVLSHRYRVIAIDVPGFGLSGKPAGPYDLATQTTRLVDFLDRWTTGPVVVVGHSMGGELATSLALKRPDRVVALVLVSPAGYGLAERLDSMSPGTIGLISWAGALATTGILPVHDRDWLAEPDSAAAYAPATDPAYRAALESILHTFDFAALRDSFVVVHQPTLLIWGRLDPTIPFAIGESIAARLPCRRFEPLDGTLHRPQLTDPDTVASLMLDFLREPRCAS